MGFTWRTSAKSRLRAFSSSWVAPPCSTLAMKALKRDFAEVRHVKPLASRADSAEIYVVALRFRPPTGS